MNCITFGVNPCDEILWANLYKIQSPTSSISKLVICKMVEGDLVTSEEILAIVIKDLSDGVFTEFFHPENYVRVLTFNCGNSSGDNVQKLTNSMYTKFK